MIYLNHIEFNITNVCNLGCTNCSTFNNFYFNGHQRWETYKHIYKSWATVLTFPKCSIIGGEPTLNPDIVDWIIGIHCIWPSARIEIFTNGKYLKFFDTISTQLPSTIMHNLDIHISIHEPSIQHNFLQHRFVKNNILSISTEYKDNKLWSSIYNSIKDKSWPSCNTPSEFNSLPPSIKQECIILHNFSKESFDQQHLHTKIILKNGIVIMLTPKYTHSSSALVITDNTITLHNNDPDKAHNQCDFSLCHQLKNGNLYQCPLPAVLPDFILQHEMKLTEKMLSIINNYKPLSITDDDKTMQVFVDSINKPYDYCSFCPTNNIIHNITSTKKKK